MQSCPVSTLDQYIFLEQKWYSLNTLPWDIPANLKHWLLDTGSLTQRLKDTFSGSFEVQVLHHDWGRPTTSEQRFLSMQEREAASIREVVLVCNNAPRVFARSILPATSLEGRNRQLLKLNNRPLGAFLFAQPDLERGPIELTRVYDQMQNPVWGRRSCFFLGHKPLAVCEYFLPGMG
ncbi:chorismate lyase [Sansalvadorimonas sp. 2012CJ34-2]|uniref:Probable chorismate pyruvate-lyase n=1 Tax=Parendozoicomonas callyspongiae TaxID=2942213 RepID=A0ABT0PED8_9GAMM|nr:chorismate lyase [Sansalvadorimonas sp. 2012CJ34-2]MCL6269749.1 chorismate lyase [Sansalvadorimonas sp. 2012CJ34-2]